MARRRMIAPEIWESSSFSKLSNFAKLIFIGLISNADDEGKGIADPAYLRSKLFPRNPTIRVSDIQNALSEIVQKVSVTIYADADGNSLYSLTKWALWQNIANPKPSIYPNPQTATTVGERGSYTQNSDLSKDVPRARDKEEKINKNKEREIHTPTLEEIADYCQKRKSSVNPQRFFDYYSANGWMVGKYRMRDWQAAVRRWETNRVDYVKPSPINADYSDSELSALFTQVKEDDE